MEISTVEKNVIEALIKFRKNMNSELYLEDAEKMFGTSDYIKNLKLKKRVISEIEKRKIKYAKTQVKNLLVSDWVKFIGITGSVAAGIPGEQDDIDILIVIKDYKMWIYRLVLWLKSFNKKNIRRLGIFGVNKVDDNNDVLCINIYAEERGLEFEVHDLFTVHELFHIIPIYNPDYLQIILSENRWMREKYEVILPPVINHKKSISPFGIFHIMNFITYCGQHFVMMLHGYSIKKSLNAYKKGRVYFFPENSREKYKIAKEVLHPLNHK